MDNRVIDAYGIQHYKPGEKINVKSRNAKYHYTSPEALLSIIKNSTVYFTDIRYFNDKSENTYIYNCFKEFLNNHPNQYSVLRNLMKDLFPDTESLNVQTSQPNYPFIDKQRRFFVFCTCIDPDSLSMWNYYVKNGNYKGYNIGLLPTQIIKSFGGKSKDIEVLFGNVIYQKDDQLKEIELVATELENHFRGTRNKNKGLAALFLYCQRYSAFFKNDKFSHEKEFRFVISIDEDKLTNYTEGPLKLDFRISNGIVTPYLALHFSKKALKRVQLSPNTEVDISKKSIKEFCRCEGYKDVEVKASTIPIRF